jgi:ribonuclease P protein component
MLPAPSRLRRPTDFQSTTRTGLKAGRPSLVFYLRVTGQPARAGFIVSKAIGNAVRRNQVKRRLRHLVAPRLDQLGAADLVIRALPAATKSQRLVADFDSAWRWAQARLAQPAGAVADYPSPGLTTATAGSTGSGPAPLQRLPQLDGATC